MSSGPEFTTVEAPFIDQLISMGRKLVTGNLDMPSVTGHETFRSKVEGLDQIRSELGRALIARGLGSIGSRAR